MTRTYKDWKVRDTPMPGAPRTHHGYMTNAPEEIQEWIRGAAKEPFVGISTDGTPRTEVWNTTPTGRDPEPIVAAARALLDAIDQPDYREYIVQPFDSWHRRSWFNAMPVYLPAGVLLGDLRSGAREKAMGLVRTCMSTEGYSLLRKTMLFNETLGDIVNVFIDHWKEWNVWLTIFGEPSLDEPWGWQLMGTHIAVNCTVVGDQLSLEPLFLGAELSHIDHGPYAGMTGFLEEEGAGLALGASLTEAQRQVAVLAPSMYDLPPEYASRIDGRHIGGATRDNRVIPYEGVSVTTFSAEQRQLLGELVEVYLKRLPDGYRDVRRQQIEEHLDETYVAYVGDPAKKPFYYRVHSPTVWIEFDHHPGLFFDPTDDPIEFHIHTIFRSPNGNDYGLAWVHQWETAQVGS